MQVGRNLAIQYAKQYGVPEDFFLNLVQQESGWNPKARSPAGAFGLTQAMPDTWRQPGYGVKPGGDINDPREQLRFGAEYAGALLKNYGGDRIKAAAAYNWGAGNVNKWDGNPANLPKETRDYIRIVAGGGSPQGGMGFLPEGGTIADRPTTNTLADQGNRAVTSGGKTLADLNEEMKGNKFHPGLALQSLGAAIAAGSQGESAAGDLGAIREAYFAQQQEEYKRAAEELQRQAAVEMVGGPDTDLGQALIQGAPLDQVMAAHAQQQGFQHQIGMQQAGFGHAENMYDRQSMDSWGQLAARQGFESEQNEIQRAEQTRQFEVTAGLARDKFDQDVELSGNIGQAGKVAIGTMLEAAGDPVTASILRSLPDNTFSDPAMLRTMMEALRAPETRDEATAAIRNWIYAQSLPPGEREEFLRAAGSGTNISINDGIPGVGKIADDHMLEMNPDGTPYIDPVTGAPRARVIPGTPTALKQEQEAAAAEAAKTATDYNAVSRGSHVLRSLDKALEDVGPHSAGLAQQATGWISGTPAKNLAQTISTISSNIAFDRLTEMRNESATGAALGSISNFELEQLQNTIASLSPDQSPKQLRENLQYIKSHYESIIQRVINSNASDAAKQQVLSELGVSYSGGSDDNLSIDDLTNMYAD